MPERPINPPDPILADVTVNVEGNARDTAQSLWSIRGITGGEASWSSDERIEDDWREFRLSVLVEDAGDYSTAEDIVHNLLVDHLEDTVDLENLVIRAEEFDPEDW